MLRNANIALLPPGAGGLETQLLVILPKPKPDDGSEETADTAATGTKLKKK